MLLATCIFLLHGFLARAQDHHSVAVGGLDGSFFDPPTLSALQGDIVTFMFKGLVHTVTQSSFDTPCLPLQGGFNSGVLGVGQNASAPPPTWSIVIQNASEPIFFFCQITQPQSHCNSGMVGAINAASDVYESYLAAAKVETTTPMPSPSLVLNGIDAFATADPITPTPSGSGASTPTVSAATTSTPSPAKPSTNKNAIIGGAVGAGVGVALLLILIFLIVRARARAEEKRHRPALAPYYEPQEHVSYSKVTGQGASVIDVSNSAAFMPHSNLGDGMRAFASRSDGAIRQQSSMREMAAAFESQRNYNPATATNTMYSTSSGQGASFAGNEDTQDRVPVTRTANVSAVIETQTRSGDVQTRQDNTALQTILERGPEVNVHELAKEVAELLGPQFRSAPVQEITPSYPTSIASPRPLRQLPDPRAFRVPRSPGPPRYDSEN